MSSSHAEKFPITLHTKTTTTNSASDGVTSNLLADITPEKIRDLSIEDLKLLAEETRARIIRVIADKGGHFGAPLGAIELAVAMLKVMNVPQDRVVWDVGHQAYAWKILTGRNEQFETIRQYKGLSGFLKRTESEFDAFGAGHASTSLSAAYGMAQARDVLKKKHKVAAIIGDGAMTGGMAYEALNNAGHRKTNLLVVLNDNEMSISTNVWAVHRGLSTMITNPSYNRVKKELKSLVRSLWGEAAISAAHTIEEAVKGVLVPGMFFEELGFRYIGPVDGHDLNELVPILANAAELEGPILVHAITKKGKGLTYAEKNPIKYHAAKANMKIETGEMSKSSAPPAYTKVFGTTLVEQAKKKENIVAITAAMPGGTGTDQFAEEIPDRFYDVGIAEEFAVTMAAGMAADGLIPVCAIYSTFLQRAFDQIIHDVAIQKLPVRFVLDRAGLVGADGPTHHGTFDLSYLRMIPHMVVMAPSDEQELRQMLHTQLLYNDGPSAMRYPRGSCGGHIDIDGTDYPPVEIGKGVYKQKCERIALVGIGLMTAHFVEAANILKESLGYEVTVFDARFVKPLDKEALREIAENHEFIFTAEDNVLSGGFGHGINEFFTEDGIDKRVHPFGIPDRFVDHGQPKQLYEELGLMPEQLAASIQKIVGG